MKKIDARFLDVGQNPEQLVQNKNLFSNILPGTISTSTSGTSGSSGYASPADHNHNLGLHNHIDSTDGGQLDHGTFSGLLDDDHTQYILANGTREFSGIPSCSISPSADDHLINKIYADNLLNVNNAFLYKGEIDCSLNPDYPSANAGHVYKISVDGKIGGSLGLTVSKGTFIICIVDNASEGNQSTVGSLWNVIGSGAGGFNVVYKSTNYTAKSLDLIEADVAIGPITITTPETGMFTVVDITKNSSNNNITISRLPGIKIDGVDENYIIDVDGGDVFFVYDSITSNWFVRKESGSPVDIDFSSIIATTKRNVLIFG